MRKFYIINIYFTNTKIIKNIFYFLLKLIFTLGRFLKVTPLTFLCFFSPTIMKPQVLQALGCIVGEIRAQESNGVPIGIVNGKERVPKSQRSHELA